MKRKRVPAGRLQRAAVAVYLAISMTVVMGMAALAVDLGVLYQAQAELQRTADAAALAAAGQLVGVEDPNSGEILDPEVAAAEAATGIADRNEVLRHEIRIDPAADVELGRSVYVPETGRFEFQPGSAPYDAVRVTVRRTAGSASGPIELMFARFLGHDSRGLQARAAAVLVPRDIALVIDLSNSMNWDSQLRFWDRTDGGYANTRDIWAALDGPEPSRPYMPGSELETEYAGDTGPTIGAMELWGDPLLPDTYDVDSDPGLWYIRRRQNTNEPGLVASLQDRGYSSDEIDALMSGAHDSSSTLWRNRTAVLIGVAAWRSGKPGGLFSGGDGDDRVDSNELIWLPKPRFRVDWSWTSYIYWMQNSKREEFQYYYGLKTFTQFLLDSEPCSWETNNLWATPQEPLRAIKDAVQTMVDVITSLESLDHMSLEIFATSSRHEINLTDNYQEIPDRLYEMQSGHYDRATNVGAGLAQAIVELQSVRARPGAHKVIVLMSDGVANIDEDGNWVGDGGWAALDYAYRMAQQAADQGFTIYTISVGYNVDRDMMQQIASIGNGQEFYAAGSPEEYSDQLELIFRTLGGKRPVSLIE